MLNAASSSWWARGENRARIRSRASDRVKHDADDRQADHLDDAADRRPEQRPAGDVGINQHHQPDYPDCPDTV